jgi:hypothetical protein
MTELAPLAKQWETWTPTWTNLTVGNGTQVARYLQVGKTVHVFYLLTLGSTSSVGSDPNVTPPVPLASDYTGRTVLGNARINAGTAVTVGICVPTTATPSNLRVLFFTVAGTAVNFSPISATLPDTFTNTNTITFSVTYEAA